MSTRRRGKITPDALGKMPKDYRKLVAAAEAQGWTVERRSNSHFALRTPDGSHCVFFSSSPKDGGRFTTRKIEAELVRHGYVRGTSIVR